MGRIWVPRQQTIDQLICHRIPVIEPPDHEGKLNYISKYLVQYVPLKKAPNSATKRATGTRVLTSEECSKYIFEQEEKKRKEKEEKEVRKAEREREKRKKEEKLQRRKLSKLLRKRKRLLEGRRRLLRERRKLQRREWKSRRVRERLVLPG